jgi:uncharacterized membrane protein YesL
MGFLNINSTFMKYLGRFADIMILGFWSIICCLPIFTIGTSISATYSVTLKMVRDEECYITKDFFKGFKENLKQSTIAWVCFMLIGIIFYMNFQVMNGLTMRFETICRAILIVIAVYLFFISGYLFPLIARFENTMKQAMKNAIIMSLLNLPKSIVILIINMSPLIILYYYPKIFPLILLFCISGVCYLNSMMLRTIFDKYLNISVDERIDWEREKNVPSSK